MVKAQSSELVAKKLRTGEIAIWDHSTKSIILLSPPGKESTVVARVIKGASFKALQEGLGSIVVLE